MNRGGTFGVAISVSQRAIRSEVDPPHTGFREGDLYVELGGLVSMRACEYSNRVAKVVDLGIAPHGNIRQHFGGGGCDVARLFLYLEVLSFKEKESRKERRQKRG